MKAFFLTISSLVLFSLCFKAFGRNEVNLDTIPNVSIDISSMFPIMVVGQVTSAQGDTLSSATVAVVGASTAVYTNSLGIYNLLLPAGSYVFRTNYVGCVSKDTPVSVSETDEFKIVNIILECDMGISDFQTPLKDFISESFRPGLDINYGEANFVKNINGTLKNK